MRILLLCSLLFSLGTRAQWQLVPTGTTGTLFCIDSYDDDHLVIGSGGNWLASSDGGNTWTESTIDDMNGFAMPLVAYYGIEYKSLDTILATGFTFSGNYPYEVRRSVNGGSNWNTQYTANGNGQFSAFNAMAWSGSRGLVAGSAGRILRSTNNGETWSQEESNSSILYDVAWVSATSAVAVGTDFILRSTDSGGNWSGVLAGPDLRAVSFPTSTLGYAVGPSNDFRTTTDGGGTWSLLTTYLPEEVPGIDDLFFTSATEGYALADDLLLHTTDGGLHWEWFPCAADMRMLHFRSPTNGYATGNDGVLYRTGGGGAYRPFALFDAPTSVCHDSTTTFLNNSGPGLTSQWFVNGEPVSTATDLSWTFTEAAQSDTLTLVVSNGTWTDTLSRTVTVSVDLDFPFTASIVNDTVCSGSSTQVLVPASVQGVVYRLYRDGVQQGSQSNGNGSQLSFSTGAITATTFFQLAATRNIPACGISTDTLDFIVVLGDPDPTVAVTSSATEVCRGDNATITIGNAQPGISYQLYRNGEVYTAPQVGTGVDLVWAVNFITASGTYTFEATRVSGGCSTELDQGVTIALQVPNAAWGPTTINPVVGEAFDLMNSSAAQGASYAWSMPGATPASSTDPEPQGVVYGTPGERVTTLVVSSAIGCTDTLAIVLQAIEQPVEQDCALSQLTTKLQGQYETSLAMDAEGNMYGFVWLDNAVELMTFSGGTDSLYVDLPFSLDYEQAGALIKYDRYGIPQWWVHYWCDYLGAYNSDVAVDELGNVYSAYQHEETQDSLRITDAGGARTTINPPHNGSFSRSVVVTSFTPDGRLRWVNTFLDETGNENVNMELDGSGHVIVQGTDRMAQFDRVTGEMTWEVSEQFGFCDISITPDDHIHVSERFNMILREYDNAGTVLGSTPPYPVTPNVNDMYCLAAERDADGNIYELHGLSGTVTINGETLTGEFDSVDPDSMHFMLMRRTLDGGVVWTRSLFIVANTVITPILRGMTVSADRVHVYLMTQSNGQIAVEGLGDQATELNQSWLLSYDLNGNAPLANMLYDGNGTTIPAIQITTGNALTVSPSDDRLAAWVPYADTIALAGDTAFTFTAFQTAQSMIIRNTALVFGDVGCLLPGSEPGQEVAQAYFTPPQGYCVNEQIQFVDASLFGPDSWTWEFPGGTPSTSTDQSPVVSYTLPGTYTATLVVSNVNGTSAPYAAELFVDVCTGINSPIADPAWSISPSLAHAAITLRGSGSEMAVVLDGLGRSVWNGRVVDGQVLGTSDWSPGNYVLQVAGQRLRFAVVH